MANEITIQSNLNIRVGNLNHQSQPPSFRGNVATARGPSPGDILATAAGVKINFGPLVQPAYCYINNLDSTNFVTVGVWYHDLAVFVPMIEVLPGEIYVLRLSRYLQSEVGTGTGTDHSLGNRLMVKANTAPCDVVVAAFEN